MNKVHLVNKFFTQSDIIMVDNWVFMLFLDYLEGCFDRLCKTKFQSVTKIWFLSDWSDIIIHLPVSTCIIHVCQKNPMYHISDIIHVYTVRCWLVILSDDIFTQTRKTHIWLHSLIHHNLHSSRQKWNKKKVERGVTP